MIKTMELQPGVVLRCFTDTRFKQGCLSIQFVRPIKKEEAALNAIIPAILLRGTQNSPDLRAITLRLDDLYGASVGVLVRKVGDYHTTGLVCGFIEEKYAMPGDEILQPMIDFLQELFLQPLQENGCFCKDFVEGEKRNLLAAIEAQRNDKRAYAADRLTGMMCKNDSYGVPRLGGSKYVKQVTPENAWSHYKELLRTSPVEMFYVGSAQPEELADRLKTMFANIQRDCMTLPAQTPYCPCDPAQKTESMEVSQGRLSMGFVSDITIRDSRFVAMQLCNAIFGGCMTAKLFAVIREKMSLCYDIGSTFFGSKGIMTVSAGIDFDKDETVRQEVLSQLKKCCAGEITPEELESAKEAMLSQLRGVHDSAAAIEGYYGSNALSGLNMTPEDYHKAVEQTTVAEIAEAAKTLKLHSVYFLKGVE